MPFEDAKRKVASGEVEPLSVGGSEPSYNSIDSFDTAKIGFWKKGHLSSKGGSSGSTLPKCISFPA